MPYSIGEVANIPGIAISTLRYYDREGLFPNEHGMLRRRDMFYERFEVVRKTNGRVAKNDV